MSRLISCWAGLSLLRPNPVWLRQRSCSDLRPIHCIPPRDGKLGDQQSARIQRDACLDHMPCTGVVHRECVLSVSGRVPCPGLATGPHTTGEAFIRVCGGPWPVEALVLAVQSCIVALCTRMCELVCACLCVPRAAVSSTPCISSQRLPTG